MAPEILNKRSYGYKVDVWSVAVVIYILLTGDMPFHGDTLEDMRIVLKHTDIVKKFQEYPLKNLSEEAKDFMILGL